MEKIIKIFKDKEELALELAEEMSSSLFYGGAAALAGGDSPFKTYSLFSEKCTIPWERVILVPTDERNYRSGHPDRNDTFLGSIFYRHRCLIVDLYQELEKLQGPDPETSIIRSILPFEVTILGLGEDGHTASLFPENPALDSNDPIVLVKNAPKPPSERISLSLSVLNMSRKICFCVTGSSKQVALKSFMEGNDVPAGMLNPQVPVFIFADRDAACLC